MRKAPSTKCSWYVVYVLDIVSQVLNDLHTPGTCELPSHLNYVTFPGMAPRLCVSRDLIVLCLSGASINAAFQRISGCPA